MPKYSVYLPMAGHVEVFVDASSEDEAIEKAFEAHIDKGAITEWEVLKQFTKGNVCYCPSPWEAEATEIDD